MNQPFYTQLTTHHSAERSVISHQDVLAWVPIPLGPEADLDDARV